MYIRWRIYVSIAGAEKILYDSGNLKIRCLLISIGHLVFNWASKSASVACSIGANTAIPAFLPCWNFEYNEEPNYTCRVSGTRGYRGWFWNGATTQCPLNSEWYMLGFVAVMSFLFYKKFIVLPVT